ncbi:MAG: hypothetical protein N3D09_01250, partial [Archaeoglobaceae archaeon]|nr:hypothetical protein [Archaeoglobaceae archaeon]
MDPIISVIQIISISGQIFAILNPIGVIPTFLSLTEGMDPLRRHDIVRKSVLTVLFLAIILAIGGSMILEFFKVSIFSLQIGGGILLM